MHPQLGSLFGVPIHTYGALIAIGFLAAIGVIQWLAKRARISVDRVLDLSFWCFIIGFVGARILFVITRLEYFLDEPMAMLRVWEGGLVFFGGPLAVTPFAIWYLRRYKLPVWGTADVLMPALTIGHMFGRLGCIAAGCCYGKPTGTDFGFRFYNDLVDADLRGIPLHPTQAYEASGLLLLFFGLLWVFRNRKFEGQVALTYFMAYPILRSLVEIFRGDSIRGFVIDGILSTSQFISILVFIAAAMTLAFRLRQIREEIA